MALSIYICIYINTLYTSYIQTKYTVTHNLYQHWFSNYSSWTKCPTHLQQKLLYFEWSPPWHVGWRLSGEGCHWEYDGKNGEFENIDFRCPWLSDTSEMGFGHDVPVLNYSDRLPHPSDLCQPDPSFWHIFWYIFWHSFWHIFWHSFWHLSDISFGILSDKSFDTLSDISSDIFFDMLSDISSDILSDISKPKPNIHSFTQKAALQTLYLPHTTQQK